MNLLLMTLTAVILIGSSVRASAIQEPKPSPTPSIKTTDQPKGEVDLALEELKKRGEGVLTVVGEQSTNSKDKITSGVINGRAIELVQPAYPVIARAAHASGQVAVLVVIDKDGKVMAAQAVEGNPLLWGASVKAAKASSFTPTRLEDKPVNVLGKIIYNFVARP